MKTAPLDIPSIFIIGLSSAGKSTVAAGLIEKLRAEGYASILLDGDHVRSVFGSSLGYDPDSRRLQTDRVLRLARLTSEQGVIPVAAIIHPFEEDRAACRAALPGYFEVHLKCDLDTCRTRDTKNVYPSTQGAARNVVGLDIDYEEPVNADLVLDSAHMAPEELVETVFRAVQPVLAVSATETD
jgi:adenylylsulfate kinase-like enzyme